MASLAQSAVFSASKDLSSPTPFEGWSGSLFWQTVLGHYRRRRQFYRRLSRHLFLLAVVLATRVPLIGNFEGEADSARYVTGLRFWVIGDRANPLIYAGSMSAGYYWLGAQLARITHSSIQNYSLLLSIVSLCATLLLTTLVYELSRYVVGDDSGLLCSLAFLISPAIWWIGIEAHPQALSAALTLAALYAYLRGMVMMRSTLWSVISVALLTAALLVKIDAVVLFPAFLGMLLYTADWNRQILRRLLLTLSMLAMASVAFLGVRAVIIGTGLHQVQTQTEESLRRSTVTLSVTYLIKQAVPIVLALGPVLFLFATVGVLLVTRKFSGEQRWRRLIWLITWCLPGWLFWLFIRGNSPRHVALLMLALLWVGISGWVTAFGYKTAAILLLGAVLLNFVVSLPANSASASAFLSPNVPGSVRALRAKEMQIRSLATEIVNQGGTACFVGSYTVPYFMLYLQQISPSAVVTTERRFKWWVNSDRFSIACLGVPPGIVKAEMPNSAYSLEYAVDGTRHRFFGNEVYSSPFWSKLTVAISGYE